MVSVYMFWKFYAVIIEVQVILDYTQQRESGKRYDNKCQENKMLQFLLIFYWDI